MREKIEQLLNEKIRPALQFDGGDCELVDVDDEGNVHLRLKGACGSCMMSTYTLKMGIERLLKQHVPEVNQVIAV